MSELIRLEGRNALSGFRLQKLLGALAAAGVKVRSVGARYWHFTEVAGPLTDAEHATLVRVLTYGPREDAAAPDGELFLVVPRFGTISPWSSKATDIARHCGLDKVRRIERGIAYRVSAARALDARGRAAPL